MDSSDINIFSWLMILTFVLGYFAITIEHITKINKTSIALLMGILCWMLQFINQVETHESNLTFLAEHLSNISQVIFFLLGALIIVETISAHKGFQLISNHMHVSSKHQLLWIIGMISFFLSSILDNLTTTIIMVTLLRKLTNSGEERLLLGGAVVIAANAGGAWTPIGDVTTTMLWIGGQLSTLAMMKILFAPSFICLIASLFVLSFSLKNTSPAVNLAACGGGGGTLAVKDGDGVHRVHMSSILTSSQSLAFTPQSAPIDRGECLIEPMGKVVFWLGIGSLIFVPIFKITTGLPPFMGIIFGLGLMWLFTDAVHSRYDERNHLRVPNVITRIDVAGVLFFLGILLSIDALHTAGVLDTLANWMNKTIGNMNMIAIAIGLISAIVDNVPLVAAAMSMYDIHQYPTDSNFWNLVAYCAGTGGSILVIGSAAGVAFMGLERVQFFWYMRRIGFAALMGYFAGIGAFKLLI